MKSFCNRVWKREGSLKGWKEGVIIPILKKGKGVRVENYRGVTLMSTLYKVYMRVLAERVKKRWKGRGFYRGIRRVLRKSWEQLTTFMWSITW